MTELVFPPSPNWYLHSIMCVGSDGWVVYGSLSNGITILTPCDEAAVSSLFQVKTVRPAHKLRVTCIDLCPNWRDSRLFISAGDDGFVKLWNAASFSFKIANNVHFGTKEIIVGAAFITPESVVSVGSGGNLVAWNIKNNSVKVDSKILKTYKALCVSGCPNKPGTIAIGTKNGVVLVLSVLEKNEILFKSHGHDTEITSLSWCPTPTCEPLVDLLSKKRQKAGAMKFSIDKNNSDKITLPKQDNNCTENLTVLEDENLESDISQLETSNNVMDESDIFDVYKDHSLVEFGHTKVLRDPSLKNQNILNLNESEIGNVSVNVDVGNEPLHDNTLLEAMHAVSLKDEELNDDFLEECKKLKEMINPKTSQCLNESKVESDISQLNISTDSLNMSKNTINDSDIFDVYKDHSLIEFGHSKNVRNPPSSEDKNISINQSILSDSDIGDVSVNIDDNHKSIIDNSLLEAMNAVSLKEQEVKSDFLEECKKLKQLIDPKTSQDVNESRKGYFANESSSFGTDNDTDVDNSFNESEKLSDTLNSKNTHDSSDIFDVYKEPSFYEFGHSKFMANSSVIEDDANKSLVKPVLSFLDECEKLKKDLLAVSTDEDEKVLIPKNIDENPSNEKVPVTIFLASSCKNGKVCIWSESGGLVTSKSLKIGAETKGERTPKAGHPWSTVYWSSKLTLLAAYRTPQLMQCAFQSVTLQSRFIKCTSIHNAHVRGLFSIAATKTDSACDQHEDNWRKPSNSIIWTAAQDRFLTAYSLDQRRVVARYTTFGGFVYDIAVSPIDPLRVAFAAGDGAVRVWERNTNIGDENGLGKIDHHWNGVQGKVQCVAWHPTREHCLAFSTFEGRVGLIDAASTNPAKLLPPGLPLGVFHHCWGPQNLLFACGGGDLIVYNTSFMNNVAEKITVTVMDRKWAISTMIWTEQYLSVGSTEGAIGLLNPQYPYEVLVTAYPQRKSIQTIAWHPIAVSTEEGLSPYSHYVAIAASSSEFHIMTLTKNDDGSSLDVLEEFSLHSERVNKLSWSPHHNARLLSVSNDCTIQIWDVLQKCVLHTLSGHDESVLCALWCPVNMNCVISAGEDSTVRVWDISKHPPKEHANVKRKQRRKLKLALVVKENSETIATADKSDDPTVSNKISDDVGDNEVKNETDQLSPPIQLATIANSIKSKVRKSKHSILNILLKQMVASSKSLEGCNRMFNRLCGSQSEDKVDYSDGYDFLALYGSQEDIIRIVDMECNKYEETHNWEGWVMVGILRGDLGNVLRKAADTRKLCPALLTLAPSVSNRFWKEMITLYGAQLQGDIEDNSVSNLESHGVVWRGIVLLSVGFIDEACTVLSEGGYFAEAICAARIRHADHLVQKTIHLWINEHIAKCNYVKAAECYIALGLAMDAAIVLGKSNNEDDLAFAAKLAKHTGNLPLAEGVLHRASTKS